MQMKFAFPIVIIIVHWHLAEMVYTKSKFSHSVSKFHKNEVTHISYSSIGFFPCKKRTYTWIFVQSDSQEFLFKGTGGQNKSLTVVTFEFL